jgi:nicotinamide riboside transporter PnuC
MQYLFWIITAFSLLGVYLNIKKKRICFVVWLFTNTSWAIIDFCMGIYPQSALFAVYALLSVWGLIAWRNNEKSD